MDGGEGGGGCDMFGGEEGGVGVGSGGSTGGGGVGSGGGGVGSLGGGVGSRGGGVGSRGGGVGEWTEAGGEMSGVVEVVGETGEKPVPNERFRLTWISTCTGKGTWHETTVSPCQCFMLAYINVLRQHIHYQCFIQTFWQGGAKWCM